jgi:hypothetical protein
VIATAGSGERLGAGGPKAMRQFGRSVKGRASGCSSSLLGPKPWKPPGCGSSEPIL